MDKTIDRWTDPDGNGYAFKDTVARAQNRATIDKMNAETADRKAEVGIERKRIDNLVKDTTDNVVEYKADNFLMSCKSDAQASTTETALNVFKNISSKSENLGNFITISSDSKIQIKKSGLYSFDCKVQVTGVNASTGRQYARLKINDVQKNEYMISLVGETDEEFTNFIVSLNEDDTISFTGESDFDDTWITLYTTIHILDYDGKVKIPDITKEVSDIRVGEDGTVYSTAGEAVRKQIGNLTEDLGDLNTSVFNIEESPNIFDKTKINQDKALVTWGTPTMTNYTYDKTGWVTSYPIAVHGGSTIHVYKFENGGIKNQYINSLVTFAKDGSFIALEGQNKNEIKLSENTAYIIFDTNDPTIIDSLMLTTEPYNGAYKEYGRTKEDKIAKNTNDIAKAKEEIDSVVKIKEDKTHIIFSFDAFKIDNRFELMKSYGFPFTIAIAQTTLTYPISKDDYYSYFINGDVDFSVYAGKGNRPADYRSDKDKWSAWVKELVDGLKETSGLYYPVMYSCQNAASSDILNQVVKENGFRMCRNGTYYNADGTTTWGSLTDRKYLIDGTKYFDYYPLPVVKQENYPTVEQIKAEIDNAIEKKKSIMLFTHYVVDDTETMSDTDCPLSKFTAVLDYVKEKVDAGLCDVKNARQFWNYYNQQDGLDIDYKRTNMRNLFDTTR